MTGMIVAVTTTQPQNVEMNVHNTHSQRTGLGNTTVITQEVAASVRLHPMNNTPQDPPSGCCGCFKWCQSFFETPPKQTIQFSTIPNANALVPSSPPLAPCPSPDRPPISPINRSENVVPQHFTEKSLAQAYAEARLHDRTRTDLHVLFVEDNLINLQTGPKTITTEIKNARCDVAEDGQPAIDAIKNSANNPYDLVILDQEMPKMDGNIAALAIQHITGNNVYQLSHSTLTEEAIRTRALDMSAFHGRLTKNTFREELKQYVRQWFPAVLPE
jgi:CheY-like chemotaxis protein